MCMELHRRHRESHNYAFKQENIVVGAEPVHSNTNKVSLYKGAFIVYSCAQQTGYAIYLRDGELKAKLWAIIMVQNWPEGILFQRLANLPNADPHLTR